MSRKPRTHGSMAMYENGCRCPECVATMRAYKRARYKAHPEEWRRCEYKRKYGITIDDYNRMFTAQGGRCAICRRQTKRRLHVDHCHFEGIVRGLLCVVCNTKLEWFINNRLTVLGYLRRERQAA